ncbi:hypothetical protein SAMN04488511_10448 [Pedobacter suwonensis]|uniref:Cxxc_20_cxxc protein n=1 Tax=Pedobacter suwonensis TaxID=332999 RepID=A0A1I0SXE5_9SPHI|nr:hypothetical protein [Pedobacter suwonensis]SFA44180.1 hypothetical protein SAMN04488511_10448 [Pedobacter suwonensis]
MVRITADKNTFVCPKCNNNIPWTEMLQFKKGHETVCSNCKTHLVTKNPVSFSWGFLLGFLGFIVPAKTISYLYDNILLAFICGVSGATLIILILLIYLYNTTEFIEAN